jgi:hypothetical protein
MNSSTNSVSVKKKNTYLEADNQESRSRKCSPFMDPKRSLLWAISEGLTLDVPGKLSGLWAQNTTCFSVQKLRFTSSERKWFLSNGFLNYEYTGKTIWRLFSYFILLHLLPLHPLLTLLPLVIHHIPFSSLSSSPPARLFTSSFHSALSITTFLFFLQPLFVLPPISNSLLCFVWFWG